MTAGAPVVHRFEFRGPDVACGIGLPYSGFRAGNAEAINIGFDLLQAALVLNSIRTVAPCDEGLELRMVAAKKIASSQTTLENPGFWSALTCQGHCRGTRRGALSFAHRSETVARGGFVERTVTG